MLSCSNLARRMCKYWTYSMCHSNMQIPDNVYFFWAGQSETRKHPLLDALIRVCNAMGFVNLKHEDFHSTQTPTLL